MEEKNQKTVVAFIAGLLIGGLLVWVFSIAPQKKIEQGLSEGNAKVEEGTKSDEQGGDMMKEDGDSMMKNDAMMKAPEPTVVANGAGSLVVEDQPAGVTVALGAVTMPVKNGWIVVHEIRDNSYGNILGAARYSDSEGLKPTIVYLLRATEAGKTYKVVVYSENGDRVFDKKDDVPVTTEDGSHIEDSFTAQ